MYLFRLAGKVLPWKIIISINYRALIFFTELRRNAAAVRLVIYLYIFLIVIKDSINVCNYSYLKQKRCAYLCIKYTRYMFVSGWIYQTDTFAVYCVSVPVRRDMSHAALHNIHVSVVLTCYTNDHEDHAWFKRHHLFI